MKLIPKDPAPALSRGLELIELLSVEGQASLEQLAKAAGWPKSSILRYLQALAGAGVVRQDERSKAWQLLKVLRSLPAEESDRFGSYRRRLAGLAGETGHCAELYSVSGRSIELIDRADPDVGEVSLNARIGFVRDLGELEATVLIYSAFSDFPVSGMRFWRWQGGEKVAVSARERDRAIAQARRTRHARDFEFNSNGIRRYAAPVLRNGHLVGILAIAQRQTPRANAEEPTIRSALQTISGPSVGI